MSFNANIPQPTDFQSDSQSQILNNFASSNASFSRNHTAFDIVSDPGKHKFVEMLNSDPVSSPPVPPLTSGSGTIYTKRPGGAGTPTDIYYTPGATGNSYQVTTSKGSSNFNEFGTFTNYPLGTAADTGGWTWLPGGLLLQYGRSNNRNNGDTITYPIPFDVRSYSIQITYVNIAVLRRFVYVATSGTAGFVLASLDSNGSPATTTISWTAIGK